MAGFAACPKCGHRPPQALGPTDACPACGAYMHKLRPPAAASAAAGSARSAAAPAPPAPVPAPAASPDTPLDRELAVLRAADEQAERGALLGRAAVLFALAVWGLRLAAMDISTGEIGGSFMHGILLVIHEAGHVFFRILGEFMGIAGGSLFQVLLPLGIAAAFLVKQGDRYGAAVCLWWAGVSLMDLAPYVYDALDPQLILLTGQTGEDGPHDWIYLFDVLGGRKHAHGWGRSFHVAGILVMLGGIAWGALELRRRWQGGGRPAGAD